ncbi:atrial natriuretic peptide receptor 1-like [Paramacrobiotus metropolitanus]|uniref:atrial natriuretic peptide receptor 1-like n=1 Tax=Paramacrobiotus metropolitanus TaxID=2943436 RepID=UPI0024461406|nr:atrial natriuretic peptide receptor 1-like [Paramacrobiotus metropolitanus]
MERIAKRLERYTTQLVMLVTQRTAELIVERSQCDFLLMEIFPKTIIADLRRGASVHPETLDSVTVMFSDVSGFADFVQKHSPVDIMTFLNQVYSVFDLVLPSFGAYKVETIKDSYMVVSGLPEPNECHAQELCLLANDLISAYVRFEETSGTALRIGLHSGSCVGGIIGNKAPRYCL